MEMKIEVSKVELDNEQFQKLQTDVEALENELKETKEKLKSSQDFVQLVTDSLKENKILIKNDYSSERGGLMKIDFFVTQGANGQDARIILSNF